METKTCSKCKIEKLVESFFNSNIRKDKRSPWCKECMYKERKERRSSNPEKYKRKAREEHLRLTYSMTQDEFVQRSIEQDHVCAICRIPSDKMLQIDHDHKTDKVRGLLCSECNHGLGKFKDNTKSILNAIKYLRRNR